MAAESPKVGRVTQVSFDRVTFRRLMNLGEKQGKRVPSVVRQIVEDHIDAHEEKVNSMLERAEEGAA